MCSEVSVEVLLIEGNVLIDLVGLQIGLELIPIGVGEAFQNAAGLELVDAFADVSADVGVGHGVFLGHEEVGQAVLGGAVRGVNFLDPIQTVSGVIGKGDVHVIVAVQNGEGAVDALSFTDLNRGLVAQRSVRCNV